MDETITEQLRERTFAFLANNNIELPIEVKNSLSDVFDENDFTGDSRFVFANKYSVKH